jgi:hypothetical protein
VTNEQMSVIEELDVEMGGGKGNGNEDALRSNSLLGTL